MAFFDKSIGEESKWSTPVGTNKGTAAQDITDETQTKYERHSATRTEFKRPHKKNINEALYTYREFNIQKKSGKIRKIVAPSPQLKAFQRRRLKDLYKDYESLGTPLSKQIIHGFVPNRNVVTAAKKHIGYSSTTMLDISNFFDSVKKDMLPDFISTQYLLHKDGYCAQGFSTSPLLACMVSINLVERIDARLKAHFDDYAFTMYADDIQISIQEPTPERIKIIAGVVKLEVEDAGFKMNEAKTRTRFAKYGFRRILGVNVGDTEVRATRKTMRKIRAARHGGNYSSLGGLTTWSKCPLPKEY